MAAVSCEVRPGRVVSRASQDWLRRWLDPAVVELGQARMDQMTEKASVAVISDRIDDNKIIIGDR